MTTYGYAMVSAGTGLSQQVEMLKASGCVAVFVDEIEGPRDGWTRLLEAVRPGDAVRVVSLSGLTRSTEELLSIRQGVAIEGLV